MKPLTALKKGEFGFIVDLRDAVVCLEVFDFGCFPGEQIDVLENCPNAEHMRILLHNRAHKIAKLKAKTIITNVVSYDINLN